MCACHQVRGLKAMDSNGKSDPYVAVSLCGHAQKTQVCACSEWFLSDNVFIQREMGCVCR